MGDARKRERSKQRSSRTRMSTTQPSAIHSLQKDSSDGHGLIEDQIKDMMSTLPREIWAGSIYLYKYKDVWLGPNMLRGLIACQNHFKAQENDVLLVTTPKSGTTWLKALLFTLLNRKKYPISQNHPLLNQNPHALVPFIEISTCDTCDVPDFRRLFSTHAPLVLLPDAVLNLGCKIVYLCRNLKDLFVSHWHFIKKMGAEASLDEVFDKFCRGVSTSGPVWEHVLDYWKESVEKPDQVLFLRYEDMKEEPAFQLKRIADFTDCPITAEEEEQGLVDEILRLCSFDNLSNLEVNKKQKWWIVDNHKFFRKGEVGDWKNYLTNEMAERLDQITAEKFHGSGLKL